MNIKFKRNVGFIFIVMIVCILLGTYPGMMSAASKGSNVNSGTKVNYIFQIGIDEPENDKEAPYHFFSINSVCCDRSGNIFVLDEKAVCVKVFDKQGKFLRKMFRQGKGPNEITGISRFSLNPFSGNLHIIQDFGHTIKEFDPSGEFVKLHRLPEQFFNYFEFIDKNRLLFTTYGKIGALGSDNNFKILNLDESKIVQSFAPTKTKSALITAQRFTISGNLLWTSPSDEMVLLAYDLDTLQQKKKIQIPGDYKKNIVKTIQKQGMTGLNPVYYNLAFPFSIDNDLFVLVTVQDYNIQLNKNSEEFPESSHLSLYRLNPTHTQMQKVFDLKDSELLKPAAVSGNRLLLFTNDPYPYIKIFEIGES